MLIILDGFGLPKDGEKKVSAIEGNDPFIEKLKKEYPTTQIGASGMDVGLPDGQMGNSEVGHLNIGAGRIVYQELTRITKSIRDGDFFENDALVRAVKSAKDAGKSLHVLGLMSDGGVHSHIEHAFAILDLAKKHGLSDVYVHCFMDGRDVSPTSGADYVKRLYAYMTEHKIGKISTVVGRYFAMDRDNRWDRVKRAYDAMTKGVGNEVDCPYDAVKASYEEGVTDEFIEPIIVKSGKRIEEGDSVIFFNFRPDRAREITRAFCDPEFNGFERKKINVRYVCMTQYDAKMPGVEVAFKPTGLENTFGEYISKLGYHQARLAETEKYAHVTFFFNGGVEQPNPNEDRVLVPSPKVSTYDLKPSMSAVEVGDEALKLMDKNEYDVIIINFANCDMVGHTGVMKAAEEAVRTVDAQVERIVKKLREKGGACIITADHGNADKMAESDGSPFTAHTTNPVPLILVDDNARRIKLRDGGKLCDIAPTLLDMMKVEKPKEMTGESLIVR